MILVAGVYDELPAAAPLAAEHGPAVVERLHDPGPGRPQLLERRPRPRLGRLGEGLAEAAHGPPRAAAPSLYASAATACTTIGHSWPTAATPRASSPSVGGGRGISSW